jgi:hypothetical protein
MANQPTQGPADTTTFASTRTPEPMDVAVTMRGADTRPSSTSGAVPLWIAIRNRRIDYTAYAKFINAAFCAQSYAANNADPLRKHLAGVMGKMRSDPERSDCLSNGWLGHGMNAYELLKTATEIFLLLECGVFVAEYRERIDDKEVRTIPGAEEARVAGPRDLESLKIALKGYMGDHRLPYIDKIIGTNPDIVDSPFCEEFLSGRVECPCFLELIWSYWHEEGMLVQALNVLSMRFQNRRVREGRDPLAQLELSPLRPLSSIFWGYVQDEQHRLSLVRRTYEYEHEYGISLRGKAVPNVQAVDRRSKFIEAFHDLLFRCMQFYREQANLQFNPDAFPLLNGLKEVHLQLSQGAGNQFGDLPWTARAEMLMQQWILARPEIREFLGRRPMVAYDEEWMANADALKTLMGWTDTSITHFRNLAVMGEKLLLSIRWHAWGSESDSSAAKDWADLFRPEIQGYVHAYRVATGVDLTVESKTSQDKADRESNPSLLLERRMAEQQRNAPK